MSTPNIQPNNTEPIKTRTDTVASLRLDAVLSVGYSISRTKAVKLVESDRVSINDIPCQQPSKLIKVGDMINVSGLGCAELQEVGGTSKKGRVFITVANYGR